MLAFAFRLLLVLCVLAGGRVDVAGATEPAPSQAEVEEEVRMGEELPVAAILPFAAMLLAIALMPLAAEHWWEHNRNKAIVALLLAVPIAVYLLVSYGYDGAHELAHTAREYVSFIILLGSLFIISGGIHVAGSLSGSPLVNTLMLGFGAVIANLVGTTGASMLLIRPLLKANRSRQRKAHVFVFFIFVVSNCGGVLTPLGDPPLFLGFLNGVPFEWTLRLWQPWLLVNGALLLVFNIWDQIVLDREEKQRPGAQLEEVMQHEPLGVQGLGNLLLLGGIVATIYASGRGVGNDGRSWPFGAQEALMLVLTAISYFATPKRIHEANRFSFGPIIEVAVLFAGIFTTMTPALLILNVHGPSLGIEQPWHFFWATGLLSSVLDNAPTYLTFAATACGMEGIPLAGRYLEQLLALPVERGAQEILAAISCGAVFMGANTYIGNGPNFMVKAIAEQNGVRMPGFFGYMLYSGGLLVPLFILVTFVFFR